MKVAEYHLAPETLVWVVLLGVVGSIILNTLIGVFAIAISREGAELGFKRAFKQGFTESKWSIFGAVTVFAFLGVLGGLGFAEGGFRDQVRADLEQHYKLESGIGIETGEVVAAFRDPEQFVPLNDGQGFYTENSEGVLTKLDLVLRWDEKNRMMELFEPVGGGKEYVEFAR